MKVIKSFVLLTTLLSTSCATKFNQKPVEENQEQKTVCSKEDYPGEKDSEEKIFSCRFKEFTISAYKNPEMENQEFMNQVYDWFMDNVFYGPELNTFNGIFFNGDMSKENVLGSYNPNIKLIEIYPNSNAAKSPFRQVDPEIAKKLGKTSIDPKSDYRFWLYTISHEYNHHSTVSLSLQKQIVQNFHGNEAHDFTLNKKGQAFLEHYGITKAPEFSDYSKVTPIKPLSEGALWHPWPLTYIGLTQNQYLWTKPELLTRALGLYTFSVPKELQTETSVTPYGIIKDDYWWFHKYNANIYEKNKNKENKPIQPPVDKALAKWAEFIDNEWYNDDAKFGEIFTTYNGYIFILNNLNSNKISLENITNSSDKITFREKPSKSNLKYYWRPFHSGKAKKISIESNVARSNNKIRPGQTYKLIYNKKQLKDAFDLKEGQEKIMLWNYAENIKVYKKDGLIFMKT